MGGCDVGAVAWVLGVMSIGNWGLSEELVAVCIGLPNIFVSIERRSSTVNQIILSGGVTTIFPIMLAGTPSSFMTLAIPIVAEFDKAVS